MTVLQITHQTIRPCEASPKSRDTIWILWARTRTANNRASSVEELLSSGAERIGGTEDSREGQWFTPPAPGPQQSAWNRCSDRRTCPSVCVSVRGDECHGRQTVCSPSSPANRASPPLTVAVLGSYRRFNWRSGYRQRAETRGTFPLASQSANVMRPVFLRGHV